MLKLIILKPCLREAQIGVPPSIVALKALLQASRFNTTPSVSEIMDSSSQCLMCGESVFLVQGVSGRNTKVAVKVKS